MENDKGKFTQDYPNERKDYNPTGGEASGAAQPSIGGAGIPEEDRNRERLNRPEGNGPKESRGEAPDPSDELSDEAA